MRDGSTSGSIQPNWTRAFEMVSFQQAGQLCDREKYRLLNEWRIPNRTSPAAINITDFVDEFQACVAFDSHGNAFRAALPDGCNPTDRSHRVGYHFDAETFNRFLSEIEAFAAEVSIRAEETHRPMPYRFDVANLVRFID